MNQHTIIGNLVRDPETGTTQGGVNWCTFTVAVNKRGKQDEAVFIRVTAWRALADSCGKWLKKGRKVCVVGESDAHGWIGQDGAPRAQVELTARDVEFLGGGQGGGNREPTDADAPGAGRSGTGTTDPETGMAVVEPEDLPYKGGEENEGRAVCGDCERGGAGGPGYEDRAGGRGRKGDHQQ